MSQPTNKAPPGQYLTFFLAGEEYAVGILRVREIIQYDTVTRVPTTPACVRGVLNLRGTVVPVVDLAVKFGLPEVPITRRTCVVIVEVNLEREQAVMGLLSDAVSQVIELGPGEIEPPPPFGLNAQTEYLLGMAKSDRKFLLILDLDRVLSERELKAVADTTLTAPAAVATPVALPEPGAPTASP